MGDYRFGNSQILTDLSKAGRQWSDAAVLFHTAMAEHCGLNTTDWKCGGILDQHGPMTAGELAKATGLTTGAITGVVDRLEKTGFARREPDEQDRRRIIIRPVQEKLEQATEMFAPFLEAMGHLTAQYSAQELATVLDFMRKATAVMNEETARLRAKNERGAKEESA